MADNSLFFVGLITAQKSSTCILVNGAKQYLISAEDILTDIPDDWFPTDTSIGLDTPQIGVKFWYPTKATATDSVQLKSQTYPAPKDALNQTLTEMGSGKLSILSRTKSRQLYPVNIQIVPTEKRQRLYKFLRNIAVGAMKTFEFEDEAGGLYLVRFVDKIINIPMKFWLKHTVFINLRKEV